MNSYYLLVLLGVVMVSYSGPLVKGALLAGANPATIAMLRMAFSAVVLLLLMFVRPKGQKEAPIQEMKRLTRKQWLWSVAASFCLALHYLTWMTSLNETSTFASVALVCTQPLFVAVLSALVLKERTPRAALPGAATALLGAILIGVSSLTGDLGSLKGDLLALSGAMLMAGHWLCNRYARRTMSTMPFTLLLYSQTALILLLLLPLQGGFQMPLKALPYAVGLALGCTLLGHQMFTIALGRVPATVVSFALLGEPVGAMVWSMLMFDEKPNDLLLIGGAVTILGLGLYLWGGARASKHQAQVKA